MHDFLKAIKTLSDKTRLRILNLLMERECCVCEVMDILGISQSTASRCLSMLYESGFLEQRREGAWTFYSIEKKMPQHYSEMVRVVREGLKYNKLISADRDRIRRVPAKSR